MAGERTGLADAVSVCTKRRKILREDAGRVSLRAGEEHMPYIREVCKAGRVMEVRKYYTGRYGKRGRGSPPCRPSSDAIIRSTNRRQETELRRKLNANFAPGRDALVTLNWSGTPDPDEMLRGARNFFRRLGYSYRKAGKTLKYVYCMEIGPRGARHIHAVISEVDLQELSRTWKEGSVNIQPLYPDGDYGKIARYMCKYARVTEKTLEDYPDLTEVKLGKRFNCSRNLIQPKVTKEVVMANAFREEPAERIGDWDLVKDSVEAGTSDLTGRAYLYATYHLNSQRREERLRRRKNPARGRRKRD